MTHDIRAQLRYLSVSAQKVRLVVDVVRGKDAVQALEILRFMPQRGRPAGRQAAALRRWPMPKRTSASAATTCTSPRSLPTKRRRGKLAPLRRARPFQADLAPLVARDRRLARAGGRPRPAGKDSKEILWVEKFIRLVFVWRSTRLAGYAGSPKAPNTASS